MPGLAGVISKEPSERAISTLDRMLKAMCHDRRYARGTWIDEKAGVYVGWTARPEAFASGMPLHNEKQDLTLVFSGEDYSDPSLRRGLRERGHNFEAHGPSYLVHLAEEGGVPGTLNGRFHGLLTSSRDHATTLFNDRYGIHRLYFHESPDAFYFAAEAKAILAVLPHLRAIDTRSLGEYITCGCVLENRSLFKGIQVLPPASAWVFRSGALQHRATYFDRRQWEQQGRLDPEAYYRELRDVFARALPPYFNGDQPIGMSLTGGLDTRMIMAWAKPREGSLPCYSFGSMVRDSQDVIVAREVARLCHQPYQVLPVGRDFLARFPEYAERTVFVTDGCTEVRHAPDLYVNELAASIAPVRMTGNYGGEILRHIRAFKPQKPASQLFTQDMDGAVATATSTYANLRDVHPLSFTAFHQTPWHHYGLLALEETQVSLRSPFLDNDIVRTVYRAPQDIVGDDRVCTRLIADGDRSLGRLRTDRCVPTADEPITAPISRALLELTFKAEYAFDYGMPHWAARIDRALSPLHLERVFLGRHKFCHFRVWYRDVLSPYVREMLLDRRTLSRPYLQPQTVRAIVERHVRGEGNHTSEIHKLLTLEHVHRLFIDSN